jgi:hypothetical protein
MFTLFCFSTLFILFKLSIHVPGFLELAYKGRYFRVLLVKQLVRDIFSVIILTVRIGSLLARLTLYDLLDDVLESYYIFAEDHTDKAKKKALILLVQENFMSVDANYKYNRKDKPFTHHSSIDLYEIYIKPLKQLFTFLFFLVEEVLKLSIGVFISYVMLVEVYSGSLSYAELTYKRF